MRYIINPFTGWEEEFSDKESAEKRATEIISNNEEQISSVHGYKKPIDLIDERWDNLEEMYASLPNPN